MIRHALPLILILPLTTIASPSAAQQGPVTLPSAPVAAPAIPSVGTLRWDRASRSLRIGDGSTPSGLQVLPDNVVVTTQPTQIATNFYNTTPADRVSRNMPCESKGAHQGVARYCAVVSHVFDGSLKPSGPESADYAIGCVLMKRDWLHSDVPGEGDCHTIFVRQGVGDAAGLLSNVAVRKGFAATLESYTGDLLPDGRASKAVNVQLGVVNTRENYEYGLILNSVVGNRLTGGLRIQSDTGSSWNRAISVAQGSAETYAVDAATGATTSMGDMAIGHRATGAATLTLGGARERDGQSAIQLSGTRGGRADATIVRAAGTDGALTLGNAGAGGVRVDAAAGTIALSAAGRALLTAGAAGVGFNGAAPVAPPVLAPALPADGSATPAQLAAAYNSLRAALIAYGLAR